LSVRICSSSVGRHASPVRRGASSAGLRFRPLFDLRKFQPSERIKRCDAWLRQSAAAAARQIARQLDVGELHLDHAAHFQVAALEQRTHRCTPMRTARFDAEPAIRPLAARGLDVLELDRFLVVVHHAREGRHVELGRRHQHASDVSSGDRFGATAQCIGEAAVAGQQHQAAVAALHGVDDEPARAAHGWQRLHDGFAGLPVLTGARDRLALCFVVEKHARCSGADFEATGDVATVDGDAIAAGIAGAGLRGPSVEQDAAFEDPFLDFAA
jgi:hypothetical protein